MLYQMEEFKVLEQFLLENQNQLQAELYGLKWSRDDAAIEGAKLTSQVNLLGVLINLPEVVKQIAAQFDKIKAQQEQQAALAADPLEKEN